MHLKASNHKVVSIFSTRFHCYKELCVLCHVDYTLDRKKMQHVAVVVVGKLCGDKCEKQLLQTTSVGVEMLKTSQDIENYRTNKLRPNVAGTCQDANAPLSQDVETWQPAPGNQQLGPRLMVPPTTPDTSAGPSDF